MGTGDFDAIVTSADPNMLVVTTAVPGERAGCLVGFHSQSSIDPARYAVWLSKANHTYRVGVRATQFAVHFLARCDYRLAERFGTLTGDTTDKFAGIECNATGDGVPLLPDCGRGFVGERVALIDEGGDHVCLVLEPRRAWRGDDGFEPLRLSQVSHLEPGHAAG